jgi:hypothetical protein
MTGPRRLKRTPPLTRATYLRQAMRVANCGQQRAEPGEELST